MPGFPIIDSHVHFIDPRRFRYAWLASRPSIDRPLLPPDFAEATAGVAVEGVVFVEAWPDHGQHMAEAQFAQALADAGAPILGIVANIPVVPGSIADLDPLRRLPLLRGARHLIEGALDPTFCLEPFFLAGVRAAAAAGLPFDLCLKHWALPFATELARRVPEAIFVLDHIGKPGIRQGLREPWWRGIAEIARLPNVICKMSGVITEADHADWTVETIRPYVERAAECFGFARLMFGSDWPVSEVTHSYGRWVEILDRVFAGCSHDELRAFYRETATRTYRLDFPSKQ
ncbi:MAG: amidohydrolase [Parvibaculaceae bacterium]